MKKILIVEDEPDVAKTMALIIENAGFQSDISLKPRKALSIAEKYRLILLDLMMPDMDGYKFLEEMKKGGIRTHVIVVTAVGLPSEVEREIKARFPGTGFVSKIDIGSALVPEIKKFLKES
ncbi:MAG: response regulator [Candidatus Micrarchaeia archaeon]